DRRIRLNRFLNVGMSLLIGTLSFSAAKASFCTTYVADGGQGICANLTSTSTSGNAVSASAVFEVSGNNLDITLVNDQGTSGQTAQLGGADVLTALLFNITNSAGGSVALSANQAGLTPTLTGTSASTLGTATFTSATTETLNEEWALASGINAYTFTNLYSVTGTGLNGPAGGHANFGGANCGGSCDVLDGPPFGLVPDSHPTGIAPGINPLVDYFAFFTLSGINGTGLT